MSDKNVNQANGVDTVVPPSETEASPETDVHAVEESEYIDSPTPEAQLAELRDQLADAQDRLLRSRAEFQNYRRRTEEQKRTWAQVGREEVALAILDVYDDFRRSLDSIERPDEAELDTPEQEAWVKGITLIYANFSSAMARLGVEPIEAVGHPFDPDMHEALMRQPAPEGTEADTVLAEVRRGYRMKDRVLRHAQVVVAG